MKIFSMEEMQSVLKMPDVLDALRVLYTEMGDGRAVSRIRSDTLCAGPGEAIYALKSMDGVLPAMEVGAVRINSDVITYRTRDGVTLREKNPAAPGQRWIGLILLFSTQTGEPLAIVPDGFIQRMRVGGTNAIAIDHMAKSDAEVLTVVGSGWQAGSQLLGACEVRDIKEIRVYSPNPDHRMQFCRDMDDELGRRVLPMESLTRAVEGADIVLCATNAIDAVFDGDSLEAGMHVACVRQCELGAAVYERADHVVLHAAHAMPMHQVVKGLVTPELSPDQAWAVPSGFSSWDQLPTLEQVVKGDVAGRKEQTDVTCFVNNIGLGAQFAAVGAKLMELTAGRDIGTELPTEWFTQNVHP